MFGQRKKTEEPFEIHQGGKGDRWSFLDGWFGLMGGFWLFGGADWENWEDKENGCKGVLP